MDIQIMLQKKLIWVLKKSQKHFISELSHALEINPFTSKSICNNYQQINTPGGILNDD